MMEKEIIIGVLGVIAAFFLFKFFSRKEKKIDEYAKILSDGKFKVKGQWDK